MGRIVGLIKGLSFEADSAYDRLNPVEVVPGRTEPSGTLKEAESVISNSLDRALVWEAFLDSGWPGVGELALGAALTLKANKAEALALAGCAGHKAADIIEAGTGLPLIHIADPLGREMERLGLTSLGLLGARFTLSDGHLRDRLKDRFKLRVLVPEPADIETVHAVIHDELLEGVISGESRDEVLRIMDVLKTGGAQAIVLAFSDLARLTGPEDSPLPLLETTSLHATALAGEAGK